MHLGQFCCIRLAAYACTNAFYFVCCDGNTNTCTADQNAAVCIACYDRTANTFTDCSDLAVRKAYAAGIVNGMTETTFSPNGTLTREQLATMLWRAVKYIQTESGQQALTGGGSLTGYTDADSVSSYAKEAVAALNKHGIMKGTSNTALSPKGSCTVEQSVLLSYRTFLKLN